MIFFVLITLVLSLIALNYSRNLQRKQEEMEATLQSFSAQIARLQRMLGEQQKEIQQFRKASVPDAPGATEAAEAQQDAAVHGEEALPLAGVAASAIPRTEILVQPPPPLPPPPTPPRAAPPIDKAPEKAALEMPPRPPAVPEKPRPVTPPPLIPPPRAAPPASRLSAFDWEGLIGVKLFSWIAGIALVLAAIFFLRYSIDQGWLTPAVRMVIGVFVGVALLVFCELKMARRYHITANAMDAAGIAILFSTFFASHALWKLVDSIPAFGLMVLVTAVAVLLSIRHDSVFIALLGLLGGFATPALLSTGENKPFGLFGYLLLLNVGLAWVAYKKNWPHLTALSLVFTVLYQWGWVMKFLTAGQLPIAIGIFLLFPVISFAGLLLGSRDQTAKEKHPIFGKTVAAATTLPLLFAVYLSAIPAYGSQYGMLFGFLFVIDIGLAAIAIARGLDMLHVAGAISTVIVFAIWMNTSYSSNAWPGILIFVALCVILYAVAGMVARRFDRPFSDAAARASLTAPVLLFTFAALAAIEPATASPGLFFGVLFFLLAILAAVAIATEEGALYFIGALFAVAAEAVWSTRYLVPERLLPALIIYAGFGVFYLGVPMAARSFHKSLKPEGTGSIILLLSIGLLLFLAAGTVAQIALWGMALLLMILNLGLFIEGAAGHWPILRIFGIVLSWIVIAVWWWTATITAILIPALLVVAGFAVLVMGGNIWLQKRAGKETPESTSGLYLALAGHFFIFFVATQARLAVPPWPFLAILAVLDLAIGVAALYTRRTALHTAAVCASQVIIFAWIAAIHDAPWPQVSMYCSTAVAFFAIAWFFLARRVLTTSTQESDQNRFAQAPVAGLFLAQIVAILAAGTDQRIGMSALVPVHMILLVALFSMAWLTRWYTISIFSVVPTALAVVFWREAHPGLWQEEFAFAGAIYGAYIAFPLLLGDRVKKLIQPYVAAVLASAVFFFLARDAMLQGGFGGVIGLLPVSQAAIMLILLWRLLSLEPAGARQIGRLALISGTALAFITAAIPLQLEKQWITIGWALQAAAMTWLYRKIPHRGLLLWSTGLFIAVFVRLVFNTTVFDYHPRGDFPIWNWYLYGYLVSAAAFFAGARLLRRTEDRLGGIRLSNLLPAGATFLLFLLLNIEIADFYSSGSALTFNFSADLSQNLTYTIGWGLFAIGLLIAGIITASRGTRIASIILLSVTIFKCFVFDLWRLGGLFRVGSLAGLAICLALVAVLFQKFILGSKEKTT